MLRADSEVIRGLTKVCWTFGLQKPQSVVQPCSLVVQLAVAGAGFISVRMPLFFFFRSALPCGGSPSSFLCHCGRRPFPSIFLSFPAGLYVTGDFPGGRKVAIKFLFSPVLPSDHAEIWVPGISLFSWGSRGGLIVVSFLFSDRSLFRGYGRLRV